MYLAAVIAAHVFAVVAVMIAAVPLWLQSTLCALAGLSLYVNIRHHCKALQIVWRSGDHWFINDDTSAAALHSIDFFSRWLVILTLTQSTHSKRKVIVVYDALDSDVFRLLRVRLKIEGYSLLNPAEEEP
ncbi:hypothetical protein AB833_26365 [Chromatiales bacterium (ex Bugula neritina AB1)]|nr:hypothetical protein AB833_26365 [Chromatiales bacterium (ex Bugula neritina AB1)]